ncbi:hypothetical protein [Chthonobacter rhizosphaerae]|uniref:hypothetical protein n=1 Tax=Chthonobacter rhizosphaerae TaxID=2735553 RepID=UPI0015EE90A1|nr:hypothetical protein [Chthonobacter rhizosphaerae]
MTEAYIFVTSIIWLSLGALLSLPDLSPNAMLQNGIAITFILGGGVLLVISLVLRAIGLSRRSKEPSS